MIRLGFIGQQRSGKDTAGEIFEEWAVRKLDVLPHTYIVTGTHPPEKVRFYSFAQPIKDLCNLAYDMHLRDDMQAICTSLRLYDAAFWVRIVENQIIRDNPKFAVVTDVRFDNEVRMLAGHDFILVGIDAPDEERFLRSGEAPENWEEYESHDSEKNARATLLNAPYIIKNDGTKEDFKKVLEAYFEEINK